VLNNTAVTGVGVASTSIAATLGGIEGSTTVTVTAATLTSIVVTPTDPSIAKGTTVQLTASGTFSDQSTQDLTSQVSWISAAESFATVGAGVGSAAITANLGAVSGSTTVTVTAATLTSLTITPVNPTVPLPGSRLLASTATFSDGTTQMVTKQTSWISSDPAVGTISSSNPPSTGLFFAVGFGTTTITATFEGVHDSTLVTVGP
jgi:Bacterial Ig-like domain (group 2)